MTLVRDLRVAGRMLRKSPVFTLVTVLVVSLGVGSVTTIFSAMNAVLFRPLPGASDPGKLVDVERTQADGGGSLSISYPFYESLRDRSETVDGLAVWSTAELTITAEGVGAAAYGNLVSGNYFDVLGVRPELGRFFAPEEDGAPLAHPVLVVSHGFWRSRLGGDLGAIGRTLRVNGHPFTLIGVAPEGFRGVFTPLRIDAWAPLAMQPALRPRRSLDDPAQAWLWTFGRLRDGVSRESAHQELATLAALYANGPAEAKEFRSFTSVRLSPLTGLPTDAYGPALSFMSLLLGAAGLVLLIASVNVGSMLSARAVARRREMAVRTEGDPLRLAPALEAAIHEIDPTLPRPTVTTLEQATSIALLPQGVAAVVTGALGAIGLLLATVGLYGVIAFSVGRRTREIGVRVALGARRFDVLSLIAREGLWLAGAGVVLGLLLAAAATRLLEGLLFGVSPLDAATFTGMSLLFVAVALLASYLPARRAAAGDPVAALRSE